MMRGHKKPTARHQIVQAHHGLTDNTPAAQLGQYLLHPAFAVQFFGLVFLAAFGDGIRARKDKTISAARCQQIKKAHHFAHCTSKVVLQFAVCVFARAAIAVPEIFALHLSHALAGMGHPATTKLMAGRRTHAGSVIRHVARRTESRKIVCASHVLLAPFTAPLLQSGCACRMRAPRV